jgi:hypothetical protein
VEDLLGILKDDERDLIREVEPERMERLDEDELLALHKRVRRARTKHTKNYRRRAAAGVSAEGARGAARPRHGKAAQRAEVFEEALSRVSQRLAVVSQEAYETLKAERLERAQAGKSSGPQGSDGPPPGGADTGRVAGHSTSPGAKKTRASSQAAGARRQAARDAK